MNRLENIQQDLRMFQHDYKNMVAGLYAQADERNTGAIKEYISKKLLNIDDEGQNDIGQTKVCINVRVEPRNFHTLRYSYTGILLQSGIHPKIVWERLGHSNILTTLNTYSHLIPGIQKSAIDVFNHL